MIDLAEDICTFLHERDDIDDLSQFRVRRALSDDLAEALVKLGYPGARPSSAVIDARPRFAKRAARLARDTALYLLTLAPLALLWMA